MAKIDRLIFDLNGKKYEQGVYVGKSGTFKVEIPYEVQTILGLETSVFTSAKKDDLLKEFWDALDKYKKAKRERTLHIKVIYKLAGEFTKDLNTGKKLIWDDGNNKDFSFDTWARRDARNIIGLDYEIIGKEVTEDGVTNYYNVDKVERRFFNGNVSDNYKDDIVGDFIFENVRHGTHTGVIIPYTKETEETLNNAIKNLHKIAFALLSFFMQDNEKIEQGLKSKTLKLLENNNK